GGEVSWRAGELFGWLAERAVQLSVNQRFALAAAADAHRPLASRATTGKTVLLPYPWCPLKQCHHGSTDHTDDDKQRDHRGGSLFASSASPVARVLRYRIVQFPRLSHRRTAPNSASAAEMAARRACEASSAVKVRSGARKRRLNASDFFPSAIPRPESTSKSPTCSSSAPAAFCKVCCTDDAAMSLSTTRATS